MVRRRMLGRRLRSLREEAGLTLEVAAPELDWSVSKLSRIETGQQTVDVHGVRSMLDLYDVGGDRWTELIALARETRRRGWWRAYGIEDNSYIGLETEATHVHEFTLDYVPGLLQTADYSRALFTSSLAERTPAQLSNAVAIRAIRQRRLTSADDPLHLAAVIDESVLYRHIGGPDVLAGQLAHLAEAAQLPTVTLQVLPFTVPRRPAMGSGFTVLHFGDLDEPDTGYVEHALGTLYAEKEPDVCRAKLMLGRARSDALSAADSLALIGRAAARM